MTLSTTTRVTAEGIELFEQTWVPEVKPKAVLCLIHGLGEHSSRYQHVAEFFIQKGYIFTAFDLRGHGKSQGLRGHYPSLDLVFKDVSDFLENTRKNFPNLPVFLYGHSLGGAITLNYALRYKPDLAGLIVTSPGLATGDKVAPWKLSLGKLLYSLLPTFLMPNGLDVENISRDKNVVERYKADPLVHDKVSARFGLDFINAGSWASEHTAELSLPLLLLYGSGDHIVSGEAIRAFAQKAKGVTYKEWEGYFHELHNEPEKADVLGYMDQWINARLK